MSSGSENRSSMAQCQLDGTVKELHKQSKVSYTRDFLISLADLDACKKLPCGFDPSILCEDCWQNSEFDDASIWSSQSRHNTDWEMYYDNLSQSSWKYPVHEGILGHYASSRVSECLVGVSTLGFRDKGYHLLHKSNQPYRPPRPYQAVRHSGRHSIDSYNDKTFSSSECSGQEMAEEERRRRASFELMRNEQLRGIQEKQNTISNKHEENLGMVALLQNSIREMRLVDKCNESEQYVASASSNNDSVNSSSIESCAFIPTSPPGFTSRFIEESLGRKSLTDSSVAEVGDKVEEGITCGKSNPVANMACDSLEEGQSEKHSGPSNQLHETKHTSCHFNQSKGNEFIELNAEDDARDNSLGIPCQDQSTPILENLSSSASTKNNNEFSNFFEHFNVGSDQIKSPVICSSEFAHRMVEEGALVSDDILAETGSKVQPKQGLKPNSIIDFDEKSDSTIEISLPDEESLMTFDYSWLLPDEDSLITVDDFRFLSDNLDKADLFGSSSPVHNAEKLSDINVTLGEGNSSQLHLDGPNVHCKSNGLTGLETSKHTLHAQQSYSQFLHNPPYRGRPSFHSPVAQTHLNSRRNSKKSSYPCNHPPHHFGSTTMLPFLFQHPYGEPRPVNHLLLQQSIPGKLPPHLLNGLPTGVTPHFPINQIAFYGQDLNPMPDLCPTYQQQNFGGLGIPNHYCLDPRLGRDNNHRRCDALLEEELRARQMQLFTGSGPGPGTFGTQVNLGSWYRR